MNSDKIRRNVTLMHNDLNDHTRITFIAAKHFGIVRVLENATNEEIESVYQRYQQYEAENSRPMVKIKRRLGISKDKTFHH